MHYEADTSGIRDAKEKVDEAKRQIEIANIQKEIDLLENQKDLLNEQIDLLDKQTDSINKYYDTQIKNLEKQKEETESYFESLTKSLEISKSKYQELSEIVDKAELSAKLKQLGIDEEALLAGSEEEFQKLKNAYMGIVYQLNEGNDEFLSKLQELSGYNGTAPTMLSDSNTELDEMNGKLDKSNQSVGNVNSSLGETVSATSDVASNVGTAVDGLNQMPESGRVFNLAKEFDILAESIGKVAEALGVSEGEDVGTLFKAMNSLNDVTLGGEAEGIIGQFTLLKKAIIDVIDTIGSSEAQTVSSLMFAINQLNSVTLDESIIKQFDNLKTAINAVTTAISGGGESSEGEGLGSGSGSGKGGESGGKGSKGEGGGSNSLTGAIEQMGETAQEVIGEPDAEGDGTVIGEFGSLETAVNDVTAAIGSGESNGSESAANGESDNLIGSIVDLGETTDETLGESGGDGVINRFEEFRDVIGEANEHVHSISDGLNEIDGKEVECTIKVNVETSGGTAFTGSAQVLGSMNLNSAEYNAKYTGNAHYEGTAEVTGDWGVKEGGNTLVGELGQELVVFPNGRFKTVGDNGAEFVDIPKNSIVFNHLQTKELLSKGNIIGRGKALASGTALSNGTNDGSWIGADGHRYRELQPGDRAYELQKAFEPLLNKWLSGEEKILSNAVFDGQKQMEKWTKEITNNTAISNISNNNQSSIHVGDIHVHCPGITSQEVAKQVGIELNHMFSGLHLEAMQQSMMR